MKSLKIFSLLFFSSCEIEFSEIKFKRFLVDSIINLTNLKLSETHAE